MSGLDKIHIEAEKLAGILRERKNQGLKIAFTNGCFDIIHAGHVRTLRHARSRADLLVVGVNSDESVARLKGPNRPVLPLNQRLRVLAGLADVDFVIPFAEETPRELILALRPDVLVKGGDYQIEEVVGREEVWSWGGKVEVAPQVGELSTRNVIKTILDRFRS